MSNPYSINGSNVNSSSGGGGPNSGNSNNNNSYVQYSPSSSEGQMNASPIFHSMQYVTGSSGSTLSSASSAASSVTSNYSLHNPRLRYYLSKSFDAEDDLEFCPDIPELANTSPNVKKFNPYTASVFSPTAHVAETLASSTQQGSRVQTPRIKKPIEIVDPHNKMRVGSPSVNK